MTQADPLAGDGTPDPQGRRRMSVASAATLLMVGFFLSRLLGLARVAIQTRVLGVTTVDATAFTTAIAIPNVVFTIVSGGALGSSFIPVFAGLLALDDEEQAWCVASGVMNGVLIVVGVAVVVAELTAPGIVAVVQHAPGTAEAVQLTRIMLLQPLFLAVSGILLGLHNSYHRFVAPAVAPLVYNVASIVGLLLVPLVGRGVAPAAWGVTVGAALQIVVLLPGLAAFHRLVRLSLWEFACRNFGELNCTHAPVRLEPKGYTMARGVSPCQCKLETREREHDQGVEDGRPTDEADERTGPAPAQHRPSTAGRPPPIRLSRRHPMSRRIVRAVVRVCPYATQTDGCRNHRRTATGLPPRRGSWAA